MIRVISGTYRGRKLETPAGQALTRPTTDRVRENIFNVLHDVRDLFVLDLFSGTGAMGIEALSRGAAHCTFVENDQETSQLIQRNLNHVGVQPNQYRVVNRSCSDFLSSASRSGLQLHSISLVFADPPYNSSWYSEALEELQKSQLCSKNCTVCFEMDRYTELKSTTSVNWTQASRRKYGKTFVEFWNWCEGGAEGA